MTLFLPRHVVRLLPRRVCDLVEWWLAGPPPTAPALASQPPVLQALIARYQDEIVERLTRIHAAPDPDEVQSRFLVLSLDDRLGAYVQCAFDARDRRMVCEVASGAFLDGPDAPRTMALPEPAIAALGRMGFSTDGSKTNFRQAFRVADPPDFATIAAFLLTALSIAFDARAERALTLTAPYAPGPAFAGDPVE